MQTDNAWQAENLGKYAYIKGRIGWRGLTANEYTSDGPYLVAGNHIENGKVNWSACDHLSVNRYRESWEIALQQNDIILTKDGTIGRVAFIDILPDLATINSTMMLIRVRLPFVSKFIYHYLTSEPFQKVVADKVSGSSIPHIFQRDMAGLKIPIPDECEQRNIVAILDTVDEAIRQTEALIAKLKQIKAGLLHDLLTYGVDENGELRDPMAHPEQFQETEIGSRPHSWDISRLDNIASVRGGKRLPNGHVYAENFTGYKYLRVLDFFDRIINYQQLENLQYQTFVRLSRYEINNGDVFISIAGSIGFAGVCRPPLGERVILTENAARIIPNDDVIPEFLAIQINEYNVQRQIESEKGTGGGVPKLAIFRIESLKVVKPSHKEQEIIVSIAAQYEDRIQREETYLFKLRQIKQGLMQDLLTGSVRVNEINLDLPEA